ncbi:ABC transporter permease [Mumia zhuanghuii]|uniref:ABC transporter permease n=1 Tax=Mumia zhuanghuii TaxID=2585211 RepID=A0A5C4MWA4_9ACTN|nr:ABC transporter permease [Mumia zhuanghuii]TNC47058.1 ABC transporter permease [Mumia zhuanghuii]TNC50386.1 ABC transporter permease [Mumia zhuanghuii]
MSTATVAAPAAEDQAVHRQGFTDVVRAEWIKLRSVRSTWWTVASLVVLGAGLTIAMCWGNADWLAGADADEAPGAFITWGMMIAQITAVVLGVLVVTSEYGTGMIRATFAAVPRRGYVLAAKSLVVACLLFVAGTVTALIGYFGGNYFFEREGIGMALEGDVLRAMYGSGLYMAGLGLLSVAVGTLLRHTAAAITITIAVCFVVSNMVALVPGDLGLFLERVMPGNAGTVIATPVTFNPNLLEAWPSFAIFAAEITVLMTAAAIAVRRRDA